MTDFVNYSKNIPKMDIQSPLENDILLEAMDSAEEFRKSNEKNLLEVGINIYDRDDVAKLISHEMNDTPNSNLQPFFGAKLVWASGAGVTSAYAKSCLPVLFIMSNGSIGSNETLFSLLVGVFNKFMANNASIYTYSLKNFVIESTQEALFSLRDSDYDGVFEYIQLIRKAVESDPRDQKDFMNFSKNCLHEVKVLQGVNEIIGVA